MQRCALRLLKQPLKTSKMTSSQPRPKVPLTEKMILGKTRAERLADVKNLNLWGQDLSDVSILASLPNVEVLSLSVNQISTLK